MNEDARKQVEELFLRYAAGVGRYVRLRVGSAELAEEITSRVFLAVVRNIHQQRGSPVGWLWAILRSELVRHFRERPHRDYPPDLIASDSPPEVAYERKEEDRLLREAVRKLSEDDQQLISMKFFFALGNQEIAEAVGLTPSNVGVKLHRALKELRDLLQKPLAPETIPTYTYE